MGLRFIGKHTDEELDREVASCEKYNEQVRALFSSKEISRSAMLVNKGASVDKTYGSLKKEDWDAPSVLGMEWGVTQWKPRYLSNCGTKV